MAEYPANGSEIPDLTEIHERDLRVIDSDYLRIIGKEHTMGWMGKVICQACDEIFDTLGEAFTHYRDPGFRCYLKEAALPGDQEWLASPTKDEEEDNTAGVTNSMSVKIEWNVDMESMSHTRFRMGDGPEREFGLKARCQKCWGQLLGRTDSSHVWTGIRCRACGTILEGRKATEEHDRMMKESTLNAMNLYSGFQPSYSEGAFLFKIYPPVTSLEEAEFSTRIAASRLRGLASSGKRKLTRNEFPAGSPGMLFLQANLLMEGLSRISSPRGTVVEFSPIHLRDDGSIVTHLSLERVKDDPYYWENRLRGNMGSTMVKSLLSAFACELAMKAISLTGKDEASKIHDLLDLFEDLPPTSQSRITLDFPEIRAVLEQFRQTFDKWRYFEVAVGEKALGLMSDTDQSQKLTKAARVILDEASIIGLGASVNVNASREGRVEGATTFYTDNVKVSVRGREHPPTIV